MKEYNYDEKMNTRNELLRAWATKDNGRIVPKSWNHVQFLVKQGLHKDIFHIGDELVCKRGNDDIIWQVIGMDIDEPADPQYKHSLTLCTKNLLPNVLVPFSARQALFYFPNGLTAGTYYFTVTAHAWVASDINKSFYFTLNKDIPAKGQIVVQNNFNVSFSNATLKTYASSTSTTAIETATMSLWNDSVEADFLGNVNNSLQTNINCLLRAFMGNCNYVESSIRQWLNRGEGNNTSWNEQTVFDRHTSYDISSLGFLKNIDNDFIKVIKPTKVKIAKSIFTENEGFSIISDTTKDRFFLLSRPQVFGGTAAPNIDEGIAYPYFENYSDLNVAGIGADKNRIKTLNGNSEQYWLRSFHQSGVFGNAAVTNTGLIDGWYNVQLYNLGVVVACNIFG